MKNEKYIAPEMEVVDVKADAVLMWSATPAVDCGADSSSIEEPSCGGFFGDK